MYFSHIRVAKLNKRAVCSHAVKVLIVLTFVLSYAYCPAVGASNVGKPAFQGTDALFEKLAAFPWVAYSPTHYDHDTNEMPTAQDIEEDLRVLYDAGFRGIVTSEARDILAQIPRMARNAGFEGVIMGIENPGDATEIEAAVQAAPDVDGYVVGKEGLSFRSYPADVLEQAMVSLREQTGKPTTTSEPASYYLDDETLLQLGDWIFPTANPYFGAEKTNPIDAIRWTQEAFDSLQNIASGKLVIFREVGLPTEGQPELEGPNGLSEYQQAEFYARLRDSAVNFVFTEAFDQPWRTMDPVESHWGLFRDDRTPKVVVDYVVQGLPPFYVYADAGAPHNHFVPEGWMGCIEGIEVEEDDQTDPYLGTSAIRITYQSQSQCSDKWAGIYWWYPPQKKPDEDVVWYRDSRGEGYDLRGYTKLTFWAKGENGGEIIECKVGGLSNENKEIVDSLEEPVTSYNIILTDTWEPYTISLYRRDLSHVAGGFIWTTASAGPNTIYLDEIRFE